MRSSKRKTNVKLITAILSLTLLFAGTLGSSLAWLLAKTTAITNTFTSSDIGITLTETQNLTLQMIPGYTTAKDPKITVTDNSEDCYVFVKIEEANNGDSLKDASQKEIGEKILYKAADGWTLLESSDTTEVYWRKVTKTNLIREYPVLGGDTRELTAGNIKVTYEWDDNYVLTNPTVTKSDMTPAPTLTFTAYATQLYKSSDGTNKEEFLPAEAWSIASSQS